MKFWKILARNSHIYNSDIGPDQNRFEQMELYEYKCISPTVSDDSGRNSEICSILSTGSTVLNTGELTVPSDITVLVHLRRRTRDEPFGLNVIAGNSDVDLYAAPSVIGSINQGSVAANCDEFMIGDRITSVNGINTMKMRPEDVTTLLDNVDDNALLEIQYQQPIYQYDQSTVTKIIEVPVERIDGTLGLTLRGGLVPDRPHLNRPLYITQVRTDGPAFRTGLIRSGDRLLKVDGQLLTDKTLLEAQDLLKSVICHQMVTLLTIEYDIGVIEAVKHATGPLLVEVERQRDDEDFGVTLATSTDGVFIECIVQGSTADRCGALSLGDQLLAIDEIALDGTDWLLNTSDHYEGLLRHATKLQVLPCRVLHYGTGGRRRGRRSLVRNLHQRRSLYHNFGSSENGFSHQQVPLGNLGVSHPEILMITLQSDRLLGGHGLSVTLNENNGEIVIMRIVPDSPAYRCGCLQVGDRVLSVERQSNLTLDEINKTLLNDRVTLEVEFDVTDTIVPSSGVFTVKLARHNCPGLGITIMAPSGTTTDDTFLIAEVRRGSIAHRSGTINAGDRLLAIEQRPLERLSLDAAFDILQSTTADIVTLKIEKRQRENANLLLDSVVYTVELRRGDCGVGPLGITIAGSEDNMEAILISRLTDGGLAQESGALHVGDRLLAINGESVEQRPLSDAIRLLQGTGERVLLKVARPVVVPPPPTDSTILTDNDSGAVFQNDVDDDDVSSASITTTSRYLHTQFYNDNNNSDLLCPSPLPLPYYDQNSKGRLRTHDTIDNCDVYHLTLFKDAIYDDYGFSVSDGLYEKGVYVNRIRKGGPAEIIGLLKPYDRIIQVNDTKTMDFDCCLTVPLIAAAGDRIELIIARYPTVTPSISSSSSNFGNGISSRSGATVITKVL